MVVQLERVHQQAHRISQSYGWGEAVWHVWGQQQAAAPLVLLHGGSGSWTHWVRNVAHFAHYRPVWALDIPGFGDSSLPAGVQDADGLVPFVAEIMGRTFDQQAIDVMGFSFGGMTAGLLAAAHPQLIQQLVLVGVPGLGLFGKELPMRGMQPTMDRAAQRSVHRHNLNAMMLAHPESVTEDVIDLQEANVARDRLRRRRIARTDVLVHAQAQWQCPVHGVWGERDALYRDTLAQVPQVLNKLETFSVVPDAGHWVMFERPEAFHAVADSLLNRGTPST
ncbi:MAG: alpha/beta hydrolase [Limnohabitans sp.]|nr:alpha/beta hydrolase [Limnohabitans sp.]